MLAGIPLDEVAQIRTTANAIGPIAVALFIAAAESLGFSPNSFRVLLQNDVLKEYLARGTYVFPPRPALKFAVDVVEYCSINLPEWKPIEFCGYHIRDSGSTAVQEVAIALANGIEYINASLERGLDIDAFAPSIYLFLSAHLDVFEEVAKFRAARRMWYKLLKTRFNAKNPDSLSANIFCYTLGSPQTAQEPLNNIVRIAYQTMAAVLGGVQTLATSSYDEALGLPSVDAVRIALRTQQILAFETGVARTADPLGGSYFVESLTDEFEEAAWAYMSRIEAEDGALRRVGVRVAARRARDAGLSAPGRRRLRGPCGRRSQPVRRLTRRRPRPHALDGQSADREGAGSTAGRGQADQKRRACPQLSRAARQGRRRRREHDPGAARGGPCVRDRRRDL